MTQINLSWYHEFEKITKSHDVKSTQVEIEIHDKCFIKLSYLLIESVSLQYKENYKNKENFKIKFKNVLKLA